MATLQDFINKNVIRYVYDPNTKELRSFPKDGNLSESMEKAIVNMGGRALFLSSGLMSEKDFIKHYKEKFGEDKLPYKLYNKNKIITPEYKETGYYEIPTKGKKYFIAEDSVFDGVITKDSMGDIYFDLDGSRYQIYGTYNEQYQPSVNIWYRQDTTPNDFDTGHWSRSDINKEEVPTSGEYFKVNPNFDDGSEEYQVDVSGVLKLDKNNSIWKFTDDEIKTAVINKLQNQYWFVNESNMVLRIDRGEGTVTYEFDDKKVAKIIAQTPERGGRLMPIPFANLDNGEIFHIQKETIEEFNKDFFKGLDSPEWMIMQEIDIDDLWIKTGDDTFCIYSKGEETADCLNINFNFGQVPVGAEFHIDATELEKHNPDVLLVISETVNGSDGEFITNNDIFVKTAPAEFEKKKGSVGTVDLSQDTKEATQINLNALPVTFLVFTVLVDEQLAPKYSDELGTISNGTVFQLTDKAYLPPAMKNTYIPYKFEFVKLTEDSFTPFKPKKYKAPAEDTTEEQLKKKYKDIFEIVNIPIEETNWGAREISDKILVIKVTEETIPPKKATTLDTIFDKIFTKYKDRVKTDEIGEYLEITIPWFTGELANTGVTYTDFAEATKEDEIIDDKGNKIKVEIGNSERYTWTLYDGDKLIINR